MDILMKYAKKKTIVILSTVASGIVTLLWLWSKISSPSTSTGGLGDMEALMSSIGSMITMLQVLFYAFLVLALATAILSGIYFFMKDKKDYVILGEFITSTINSVLLLLSISGVNTICKLVKVALSGDYSALMSMDYAGAMSSITSAGSNLKYFMYLSIVVFIFNIVVLLIAKKVININGFEFTLEDTATVAGASTGETTSTPKASVDTEGIKAFFQTKNGKTVLAVIAAVVVLFGGYKIYDTFFNYTKIDLASNITCDFAGKDGRGYLTNVKNNIDYDKTDPNLETFIDTTYLDYDNNGSLSNGDKVTITVKYSAETAKARKIKVTNDSKTFTVKGLTERYKKAKNLPPKLVSQLKKEADQKIKKAVVNSTYRTYTTTFDSMYFAKGEEYSYDRVAAVYKVDEVYTSYSGQQTNESYYVYIYISNVDSDYLDDYSHYWYGDYYLYDNVGGKLTDPSGIVPALRSRFTNYQIEKINVK